MSADWRPIALGRDVPAGETRAVILEGQELVIWRGADGEAHIWEDRCPHRGMRLSFGFVRENALNCLYHGWQYGSGASCQRIPAHPDLTVPPTIKANAYPSGETAGMIWVRLSGEGDLPKLPDRTPVQSVAVAVGAFDEATIFALGALHVGWHRVSEGKVMLHAVADGSDDMPAALAELRALRNSLERSEAA